MRDSHRADAERLLARAVEEEVRRSGGRTDRAVLLSRSRGALVANVRSAAPLSRPLPSNLFRPLCGPLKRSR